MVEHTAGQRWQERVQGFPANAWRLTLRAVVFASWVPAALGQPAPNARPTGGTVAGGQASIAISAGVVNVTFTTQRAVINWQSFDIGSRQQVVFTGPSANAAILNVVTGPNPSQIGGRLNSKGQVYLVNASGVTYSKGSEVDVSGFISTSTDISGQNFLNGGLVFDRSTTRGGARIVNNGHISVSSGGILAFVAPRVANAGAIMAPRGSVAFGSGGPFRLNPTGSPVIELFPDTFAVAIDPFLPGVVVNTGVIRAQGGGVLLAASTAQVVAGSSILVGGIIDSKTAQSHSGAIVVSAGAAGAIVDGMLDASGAQAGDLGGNVQVLGSSTVLRATSMVDVSGEAGSGTVGIGTTLARALGGPAVTGQTVSNSTTIDQGAQVAADALSAGNGGRVVILASPQGTTSMAGSITARGGNPSGNGGFVEISGGVLNLTGTVDAGALFGLPGTLLLDPYDFKITRPIADALSAQLFAGRSGKLIIQADHDIEVETAIDGRGGIPGTQLIFDAGNQFRLNADVFTNNAPIEVSAGSILAAPGNALCAGASSITVKPKGLAGMQDLFTRETTTFSLMCGFMKPEE